MMSKEFEDPKVFELEMWNVEYWQKFGNWKNRKGTKRGVINSSTLVLKKKGERSAASEPKK